MKDRLLRLLAGARDHRVLDLDLPVPFSSLVQVNAQHPIALLDRAVEGSVHAGHACAVVAPRFTLTAERARKEPPPAEELARMPWDDEHRPRTRVALGRVTLSDDLETDVVLGSPLAIAEELFAAASGSTLASDEPFLCGFVGYFGYEAKAFVDSFAVRARPAGGPTTPDVALLFADAVITTRDASARRVALSIVGRGATRELASADADALVARVIAVVASAATSRPPTRARTEAVHPRVVSSYSEGTYAALVERAKEHIVAGDVFQLCLTHRVSVVPPPPSPADLYEELRTRNPAPFSSFLRIAEVSVVSSSPERFLRLLDDGVAEARPIKGTRPRGSSALEDDRLAEELAASEKDGAENDMIVDLLRNDLAKVSLPGSVVVRERRIVERHPSVLQLVSTIVSQKAPQHGPFDLLRAAFPGGSMTGAPKVRAVDLLSELEPDERGVYSGAIGYVDARGTLDMAIAIRTFVFANGGCTFGIGGGIVLDSDPRAEWLETLDKARALVSALSATFGEKVEWELPKEEQDQGVVRSAGRP